MSRGAFAALGLAAALLVAGAAPARADSSARWWIVPGGQVLWPASALNLEDNALGPGAIAGLRLDPNWAFEGRIHYAKLDPASGTGAETELWRGEGNLTYFLAPEQNFSPYFTGGVGDAGFSKGPLDGHELAWNAGIGFLVRFNEKVALRMDARSVSMRHPVEASGDWLESAEIFGGISFGFGAKKDETADADHDGVVNRLDRCPNTPHGARVDADGCPLDSDGDGVWDGIDECPRTRAGVRVDARGCPKDSDGDGVWDGIDECPETPAGVKVDKRGCTVSGKEQELLQTGMIRIEDVHFDPGKSTIKDESHGALDEVAAILNKYDDLKIEIGGHTDARGDAAFNQTLSEARAKAVRDYLISKHNLSSTRFSTTGYGESHPVASNDTEAGMAKNRRVEFKVMNPEALKR